MKLTFLLIFFPALVWSQEHKNVQRSTEADRFDSEESRRILSASNDDQFEDVQINGTNVLEDEYESSVNTTNADNNGTIAAQIFAHKLVKGHGILMLIGWIVLAPTGIILARYFKRTFPQAETIETEQLFDETVTFQLHRLAQTAALLSVVAAFVLVLIALRGSWVGLDQGPITVHAVAGLTAIICILTQPVLAAFRCTQTSKYRPFFMLGHRIIGIGGFMLSSISVWKATEFYPGLQNSSAQVMVIAYWAICFLTVMALEVQPYISRKLDDRRSATLRAGSVDEGIGEYKRTDYQTNSVRICLLMFFGLASAIICSALATMVGRS